MIVNAQEITIGGTKIVGPLDLKFATMGDVISTVLNFIFPFGALILLIMLIWGGYSFMTSQGDPEKVMGAKAKLTTSIIGFVLLVLSYFFVRVLAFVFKLDDGGILF